jgi:hypothetical protein
VPSGTGGWCAGHADPAGSARFSEIRDGIAQITGRLYGGFPAADLAVAHRVLAAVTERANAVLAAG